ncbi:glycosyltransferase family 2 protein [Crateriforma conspicua]|uniref:Glycosyl transferase family 2 n=1 Tax=Crateriforma conspicua TaxID=2527996 RepID=A0A5C5XVV8_9PLAN|nr:glycosyltransferase family 2 protein [Crateriforma conspicua]QDV60909.1 hypothetical protein Mal65_00290 [Crateriforma conspicua]TWT65752.1 hypothetical protein Pan14r_53010 [Crateriforma conspicua]
MMKKRSDRNNKAVRNALPIRWTSVILAARVKSVPRFPSIPQLSVIVPVNQQVNTFESSLVSVLENQPESCEVIVAHDGGYDDPFDLGDEVRFVQAGGASTVELVQEGVKHARGHLVHVIADGMSATAGWASAAVERFEDDDVGFVSPTIRHRDGDVLACGWTDTPHRLCTAVCAGQDSPRHGDMVRSIGCYLQAGFWRRDLLASLGRGFVGTRSAEATYAYGLLARRTGWRSAVAVDSVVLSDDDRLPWDRSTLDRGQRLRSIRHHLRGGGWATAITAGLRSAAGVLTGSVGLGEAIGQATAPLADADIELMVFTGEVISPDDYDTTIRLPERIAARKAA